MPFQTRDWLWVMTKYYLFISCSLEITSTWQKRKFTYCRLHTFLSWPPSSRAWMFRVVCGASEILCMSVITLEWISFRRDDAPVFEFIQRLSRTPRNQVEDESWEHRAGGDGGWKAAFVRTIFHASFLCTFEGHHDISITSLCFTVCLYWMRACKDFPPTIAFFSLSCASFVFLPLLHSHSSVRGSKWHIASQFIDELWPGSLTLCCHLASRVLQQSYLQSEALEEMKNMAQSEWFMLGSTKHIDPSKLLLCIILYNHFWSHGAFAIPSP